MFVTLVMSDCLVLNPTHQIKFDQRAVEDNRCHCLTEWLECELLAINMILTILTQANYSNVNLLQQIKRLKHQKFILTLHYFLTVFLPNFPHRHTIFLHRHFTRTICQTRMRKDEVFMIIGVGVSICCNNAPLFNIHTKKLLCKKISFKIFFSSKLAPKKEAIH